MILSRRSADRGHFDHGWLKTWHTFSFTDYVDPKEMGYGPRARSPRNAGV
jgi:hypothetical protein